MRRLPDEFSVAPVGAAHVVVGPTGVYVIMAHDGSIERARGLGRLAATIRSAFAERMAWVPFVHAMLIDDHEATIAQATVVPLDLLPRVLTEGRATLEDETVRTILDLIASGALDGLESVAPPEGARMRPCSDSTAATGSASPSTASPDRPLDVLSSSPTQPASTVASGSHSPTA